MRALTADQVEALRTPPIRPATLVDIDHPKLRIRAWSGTGDLDWNGVVFKGLGLVAGVSAVRSTQEIRIQRVRYMIRALPKDVQDLINVNVRNRQALQWLALLDDNHRIGRAQPIPVNDSRLDRQVFSLDGAGRADLSIEAINGIRKLEIASSLRWTPEDQKVDHPSDIGLDRVYLYQNREVTWTRT